MLFEGAKRFEEGKEWDLVLFGAPLDMTETYRPGSSQGPDAIRAASVSIETYSPSLDVDISEYMVADMGNLSFEGADIESSIEAVYENAKKILEKHRFGIFGGEHTVTLGALKAVAERYENLYVVVLDAHTDLRDEYEGTKVNHATWLRRALEIVPQERVLLLGVRSGTRDEFRIQLLEMRGNVAIEEPTARKLRGADAVYLSFDIDVLDSPYVPGCGNPEPGGLTYREAEEFLHWLGLSTNIVGFDIVEVAPQYDAGQITAITAARLAREIVASTLLRTSA